MRLVLLSPPDFLPNEITVLKSVVKHGPPAALHVRKPAASKPQLRQFLDAIPDQLLERVMLHQHHDLAQEYPVKGIHYPERLCPAPPLQPLPNLQQSTSFHSLHSLEIAWGALDYAFLSPIFDSISKEGYKAAGFDQQQLCTLLQASKLPIIALGGVEAHRVQEAAELGFAGIAVIGSVWMAPDPAAAYKVLQEACR